MEISRASNVGVHNPSIIQKMGVHNSSLERGCPGLGVPAEKVGVQDWGSSMSKGDG